MMSSNLASCHRICFFTVARSDIQRILPVLGHLQGNPSLKLFVIPASLHQSSEKSYTYAELEKLNVEIVDGCESHLSSDSPASWVKEFSLISSSLSILFARYKFDSLVLFGDRYEMLAAATSSLPFNINVIHLMGGAVTMGAIDDSIRHAITKLSHLHLTACSDYSKRVIQMGENPDFVHTVGSPGIDYVLNSPTATLDELSQYYNIDLARGFIFSCFHPVTQELSSTEYYVCQLLLALEKSPLPIIFSYPNTDPTCDIIIHHINLFCAERTLTSCFIKSAQNMFASTLRLASCVVGNSSAGIVECSAFGTPAINIGTRQTGKAMPPNVVNCAYNSTDILNAINHVLSLESNHAFNRVPSSIYGDGTSSENISSIISSIPHNPLPTTKTFYDLPHKLLTPNDF